VAGGVGGIQDQIVDGESGLLVDDPTDLRAVAEAVDSLLADPARAARMGEAARERIRTEFLGSRHLIQYAALIANLIAPAKDKDAAATEPTGAMYRESGA
jgi:trehalose synthase